MVVLGQQAHSHFVPIPLGLTRVEASFIYRYSIQGRVSLSRIYRYTIVGRVSLSRVYRYSIVGRVSLSRIYLYNIAGRISLSHIYRYTIQARVSLSRIYQYTIAERISLSRIYRYGILGRVALSRIYNYSIIGRISLTRVYKYTISERISLSRIYRYGIQARISLSHIYLYNILSSLTRVELSRIYRYSLQSRVSLSRIYRYDIIAALHSFTPTSFTFASFTTLQRVSLSQTYRYDIATPIVPVPVPSTGGVGGRRRRPSWLNRIRSIAQRFFRPTPLVKIPRAQPPKTVIIEEEIEILTRVSASFTFRYSIEEPKPLSVVASIPILDESPVPDIHPAPRLILNPLTSPLIQTKVTLPRAIKQPAIPPYMVGEGSHIESQIVEFKKPSMNKSRAASTINTLMILLEIERQV